MATEPLLAADRSAFAVAVVPPAYDSLQTDQDKAGAHQQPPTQQTPVQQPPVQQPPVQLPPVQLPPVQLVPTQHGVPWPQGQPGYYYQAPPTGIAQGPVQYVLAVS